MDDDQQFCLRWNNHQSTLISVFDTLLENGTLVDCTLAAEGKFLKAHKVVLSACSPYFATLLSQQYDKHPIFILKDVKFQELRAMMDYMYRGEVNISQDQLAALLKAAESLQIKGLSDNRSSSSSSSAAAGGLHQQQQQQQQQKQQSETTAAKSLQPPVPANKASGLTIENKRPLKSELLDSDVSGSREGSTSPTSRKRKKVRRRSVVDTNNVLIDNHDQHSNSSSHSIHTGTATAAGGQVAAASGAAAALSSAVSGAASNSSANVLSAAAVAAAAAIKKTETVQQGKVQSAAAVAAAEALKQLQKQQAVAAAAAAAAQSSDDEDRCGRESIAATTEHDDGNDLTDNEHDGGDGASSVKSVRHRRDGGGDGKGGSSSVSDLLLPKNEYDDVQDENVEDLTLDDEELMDELDQAGPSHGGDASSQGYAQWPLDREQNEAFIAAQDAAGGQHRDAQDILPIKTAGGSNAESGTVSLSLGATGLVGKRINNDSGSAAPMGTSGTAIVNSGAAGGTTISIVKFDSSKAAVVGGNVEEPKVGGAAPTKKMASGTVVGAGKLSHPRIKYSRAKNPYASTGGSVVSSTVTLPILTIPTVPHASLQGQETTPTTATTIAVSDRPLLNFSLSRKLNTGQAPQQHVTITGGGASTTGLTTISAIQQLPVVSANLTTPRGAIVGIGGGGSVGNVTRYAVNEYETTGSNTSVHSADFPPGVIDELDYSVIDDIDLSDEVQTNYSHLNVVGGQQQQQQSMQNPPALVPVSSSKASSDVENNGSQSDEEEDGDLEQEEDGMLIEEREDLSIPRTIKLRKSDTGSDGGSANTGGSTGKLLNVTMAESKYGLLANTNIMKNFEYTVNESSVVSSVVSDTDDGDSMRQYICRHCGKRYRWKSTLRRHENVECGGKEASHQCPYCTYKAKQRGNLGVHIRKHHAEMPQLESRRRSNKSRDSI
ncbi:longitudinals lacking protein-like isoform X2 [Anopheles aquasalis]|uniref:longitudinals lacking protein-like isoform X2 n=1 Tax=Anopheles aquasalis TaxID=42839 RepID=UPI00215B0DC4|nr:longitudinals lacking protein-like isoform X2 [Anopheles aquasalis]